MSPPCRRSGDHPAKATLPGLDQTEIAELAEAVYYRREALKRTRAAIGAGRAKEMVTAKLAVLFHLATLLAAAKNDLDLDPWSRHEG